ncbi:sulfur globule protein precursor [Rhizobium sp. KVB221]|uniref:Sulfur globule protein n=1 Tax=Rhizobium setariae TaxID=2801340 RepID=A0A936YPI7_9HYPH|nr:sulfur globule protein precursor [Rhizobium setariae]MBL0374323.1 sulfur globule protein precursor [Rhizobium setariae]
MKKLLISAVAATVAALSFTADAQARNTGFKWHRGHGHGWHHGHGHGGYWGPGWGWGWGPTVVIGGGYYGGDCYIKKVRRYDANGNPYVKRVRRCQ